MACMTVTYSIPFRAIRAGKQLFDSKGASVAIYTDAFSITHMLCWNQKSLIICPFLKIRHSINQIERTYLFFFNKYISGFFISILRLFFKSFRSTGMTVAHYIPFRAIRAGKQLSDSKGASAAISTEAAIMAMNRDVVNEGDRGIGVTK